MVPPLTKITQCFLGAMDIVSEAFHLKSGREKPTVSSVVCLKANVKDLAEILGKHDNQDWEIY